MSKRKSSQENKKILLDAGLSIIIEQGFNHTGIQEIVDAVGIPKGSFYNYFDSKEAFGSEVIWHYANHVYSQLELALNDKSADALSSLQNFFKLMLRVYEDKHYREGCLVGNLAAELADMNETIRLQLLDVFSTWQKPVAELLAQAQADGKVRKDIPADALAYFIWNGFEGALIRMKVEKSIAPLSQWYDFVLEDFVLAARK